MLARTMHSNNRALQSIDATDIAYIGALRALFSELRDFFVFCSVNRAQSIAAKTIVFTATILFDEYSHFLIRRVKEGKKNNKDGERRETRERRGEDEE